MSVLHLPLVDCFLDLNNSCFSTLYVRYEGAANTTGKLSYRVLNRSDQTNDLIVIKSKENGNVAVKIKTRIDRSPVVTPVQEMTLVSHPEKAEGER